MKIETTVMVFKEIIPSNIHHAITLFTAHIHQMLLAYNNLIIDAKQNGTTDTITKSEGFENSIKKTFDGTNSITPDGFIGYIEKFILETNNSLELQKVYNFISEKLKALETDFIRLCFNPIYPHYKSLFEDVPYRLFLYIIPIGQHHDINGNYDGYRDYFTADNLFDTMVKDLEETKEKVDSLFSIKKLNEITPQQPQPITTIEQPQKQIEPIKWQKDAALLAYLFSELKNKGIVEDKNVWQKLAAYFIDKDGNDFKNTDFPNYITSYTKGKTVHNKKKVPKEHAAITDILTILIEVLEKHKK